MKKMILSFIVFVVLLFSIGTVSAVMEETITNSSGISTGVVNTNNGGILTLEEGLYDKSTDRGITINKNITIKGNGNVTIDAKNSNRMFTITGTNTVIFENLVFINGRASSNYGGAIYTQSNTVKIIIKNCTFINNTAQWGGAISTNQGTGELKVYDSVFVGNTAISTGTTSSTGGAIQCSANIYINNSYFENNSGEYGGAIGDRWNRANNITVNNCNFINNTATSGGGAINTLNINITIQNCTFINNTCVDYGNAGGGAIYLDYNNTNTLISGCTFIGNYARFGGAIHIQYGAAGINILNNTFTNNTGVYGVIYINSNGNVNIIGNNIINNEYGVHINYGNVTVNYNRIITISVGIYRGTLNPTSTNVNGDFNWFGENSANTNFLVNNYFIMDVKNLTALVDANGTVKFQYIFVLNTGKDADNSKLPYFITEVTINETSGILNSFDAWYNSTIDVVTNVNGSLTYTFTTDNQIVILYGNNDIQNIVDINETNDTNETNNNDINGTDLFNEPIKRGVDPDINALNVDSIDSDDDMDENIGETNDIDENIDETINNLVATATMKETGIPLTIILLVIISCIGALYRKN